MASEPDADPGIPILIVEDEAATVKLMVRALETYGYEARVASSAEEAMSLMVPFNPRAIVLDLVLPRLSGLMWAEQLRRDPATRDVPIIATSRFSDEDAGRLARDAGCAHYFRKPIDPASLARLVRDHLARAK
jgi:two-component system, OmpR family, phosphate regulon response regulator PhoB